MGGRGAGVQWCSWRILEVVERWVGSAGGVAQHRESSEARAHRTTPFGPLIPGLAPGQTDRQISLRQTDRQIDKQTDRQDRARPDGQTDQARPTSALPSVSKSSV